MYAITVLIDGNRVALEDVSDSGRAIPAASREDALEFVTLASANKFIATNVSTYEFPEAIDSSLLVEENFAATIE